MARKTKTEAKKQQQTKMQGKEFDRPNRIPEVDKAAEDYRKARDKRQAAGKVELEKKAVLKDLVKKHGLSSYFYDDDDGDTEEVTRTEEVKEDVKVNKVKQAKAKADE